MSQTQTGKNYTGNSQFLSSAYFISIADHDNKPINFETNSRNNLSEKSSDEQYSKSYR